MSQVRTEAQEAIRDVSEQRIARVYAEALLNAANKRQQADEILEQLDSLIRDVFPADAAFEVFLSSSAISRQHKPPVIRRALEGRASDLFLDFLLVLNEHERLGLLRSILAEYRVLLDQQKRRVRVLVRSAVELPDDQRQRLQQQLRETLQKEPMLDTRVDPDLLGGLVVQVGDWLYDASVRSQLANIRNQLIEKSGHEIQSRRDRFRSDS
jgi:F-type H+-transporting ATPase subunit delta